ncbi:MAG: F0F1 ATP synthase subunit delta [Eubacteriales bacterium]
MRPLEQRYAQALFELTQEEAQFRSDTEFLTGDSSLWKVLCSPCVSTAEKHALLERLSDTTLLNFTACYATGSGSCCPELTCYHALCLDAEQAQRGHHQLCQTSWKGPGTAVPGACSSTGKSCGCHPAGSIADRRICGQLGDVI